MSRIYKLKTVSSRTSASVTEEQPGAQLLSLKIRQQEHHAQMHDSEAQQQQGQLRSQMFRIQLENQKLEMKLNQLCSQETREEPAANQPVQKQFRPFQLKEQNCNWTPQLIQFHQKIQQDHEPDNQMAQPKDEEICNTQKSVQPLQQHYDNQRTQSKLHQLNQSNFCTSFTINPKSSHSPENHPKNPGRSLTVPPPSASPSISPSQSPSLPLFSLRNSAAGLSKRGKTITINPRTLDTGMSSLPSPGVTGLPPSAPSPTPHITEEKGKKRYPTVEEIEVIGGYQILEKSCLAKGSQKTVKVSFDEVQLEQLFEYPPESSLLASFLSPPRPGNETDERKEDEEDEDDEEEKEVFLLRSSRTVAPKFHLLKFSL